MMNRKFCKLMIVAKRDSAGPDAADHRARNRWAGSFT